jgi:hypothetical protein
MMMRVFIRMHPEVAMLGRCGAFWRWPLPMTGQAELRPRPSGAWIGKFCGIGLYGLTRKALRV